MENLIVRYRRAELNSSIYYFECCAGLGDTMLTCGYLHALMKKYNAPIHLIVKKTHAFIMEMYEVSNYWILGNEITEGEVKKHTSMTPRKGYIYPAHPCKHPHLWDFFKPVYYYTSTIRFLSWFRQFLQVGEDEVLDLPKHYPQLSEAAEKKCLQLAPLDKLVLFSPEATSVPEIPRYYWEEKAQELTEQGLAVVSNVINPCNTISGTHYIDLTIKDAIALAMKCHSVYSLRSGFCDLLFSIGPKLHVLYPLHTTFFLYEINEMFPDYHVDEQIVLFE